MAVRSTMNALISRVRLLINDPSGASQIFTDQAIQDKMDEARLSYYNESLTGIPTFSGASVVYLDYESQFGNGRPIGGWEDGYTIKQYLTVVVTPSVLEPIIGHWTFAADTRPPVFITGNLYDVYRSAADLLEMWAAQYATRFDFTSDGQSFRVSQAHAQLLDLAHTYRQKQRARTITVRRGDLAVAAAEINVAGPTDLDYFATGDPGR
jgi:hypothetical protein